MTRSKRRTQRAAALVVAGVSALGLAAAPPVHARTDIHFAAGPHNARLGKPVHLSGSAVDDNATWNRFCMQKRSGHGGWHTIRCSHGAYNGGGGLNVWVRPDRRGLVLFRGVLFEGDSPRDRHPDAHLVSRVFALAVR